MFSWQAYGFTSEGLWNRGLTVLKIPPPGPNDNSTEFLGSPLFFANANVACQPAGIEVVRYWNNEKTYLRPNNGARFLLLPAKPLWEPLAWRGPIMMNSREEAGFPAPCATPEGFFETPEQGQGPVRGTGDVSHGMRVAGRTSLDGEVLFC
jgi:hypothetical protein